MTSLRFPDSGTRLVEYRSGVPAAGQVGQLFADQACTTPAEVYADNNGVKGSAISGSTVTLDQYGQQPDYWGPAAGTSSLWIRVNGVVSRVDADYDARIDSADQREVLYVNVRHPNFGAVGDGTTDDTAAIVAALAYAKSLGVVVRVDADDYINHDHRGVSVYFPAGSYVTNSPIVLPRSGTYRANTVGLVGQNHASSRIVAGGSFPSNRGLIEWEDVTTATTHKRVRDQEIRDLTLVPKNAVGSYAIWFKLLNSVGSYGSDSNNIDTMYSMRLENLVVFGHNDYHQSLIRIEGRCDYSLIRNVCADTSLGTTYSTRLLHFDDMSLWSALPTPANLYDNPGFNYGVIDTLTQGLRGGLATMIYGRVNSSQVKNVHNGQGALGQNPAVYIRDGGLLDCHVWTSEGRGENGIFTFENCYGVTLHDFGLGTVDLATAPSPGSGLRLVNVQRSRFVNRQSSSGAPSFSTYSSKLVTVDANCKDIAFVNWSGNGSLASEWSIDPAAAGIEVDYYDLNGSVRYHLGKRTLPTTGSTTGGNLLLSGHPMPMQVTVLTNLGKDTWRIAPVKLESPTTVSALKVVTTAAASGGTASMIFGLFSAPPGGRPDTRLVDLSTYGSIDLTATAGTLSLTTAGLVLPAGEWYLGAAWSGTATTGPSMYTLNSSHPSIAGSNAAVPGNAYFLSQSGASVPSSITVSVGTVAWAIWAALA